MNKEYWLKGGIIGFILSVIYVFLSSFGNFISVDGSINGFIGDLLLMFLVMIPFGFLPGVIIGWIYGKIKNRNKGI